MISVPTLPVNNLSQITYDSVAAGGSGGGLMATINRNWTHTLTKSGILVVFAGVLTEGQTTEINTTVKCNGVDMNKIHVYRLIDYGNADRWWGTKLWIATNVPAGNASISVAQGAGASLSQWQYFDAASMAFSGVSEYGSVQKTLNKHVDLSVNTSGFRHLFCGVYGDGTPVTPGQRLSSGWAHVGDNAVNGNPMTISATPKNHLNIVALPLN